MLKKSHDVKLRQKKLFAGLFLLSTFFSFINLFSFLDINIYPEYFLALMVLTISSNLISISITKVFSMRLEIVAPLITEPPPPSFPTSYNHCIISIMALY